MTDVIDRHRKMVEEMDLPGEEKSKVENNLDQMEQIMREMKVFQDEWKKVEEYNNKIQEQSKVTLEEGEQEGENSPKIAKLSMELMTPSVEATLGIQTGKNRIKELVEQNMEIVRKNRNQDGFDLSNHTVTLIILNILIWGIVLYLLFFGPRLRLPPL